MESKKAAMELSVTFLIGIILGVLILGIGLIIFFKLLAPLSIIEGELPDSFDILVKDCVDNGKKTCIPEIQKDIHIRETKTFGLVINNIYGETKNFKPYIRFSTGVLENGDEVSNIDVSKWTFSTFREITLENNKYETVKIPMQVPSGTKRGTYIFNVNVCFDSDVNKDNLKCTSQYPSLYDNTHQITIVVP